MFAVLGPRASHRESQAPCAKTEVLGPLTFSSVTHGPNVVQLTYWSYELRKREPCMGRG
jgi:hypothetical protein